MNAFERFVWFYLTYNAIYFSCDLASTCMWLRTDSFSFIVMCELTTVSEAPSSEVFNYVLFEYWPLRDLGVMWVLSSEAPCCYVSTNWSFYVSRKQLAQKLLGVLRVLKSKASMCSANNYLWWSFIGVREVWATSLLGVMWVQNSECSKFYAYGRTALSGCFSVLYEYWAL